MGAGRARLARERAVSARRELERQLEALAEIRGILDAMRNLALLETRKIERFLASQRRVLATLEDAAADVAYRHAPPRSAAALPALLLIGSERGFCGDFNEALLEARSAYRGGPGERATLIAIGARLSARLGGDPALALSLAGPSVAEEVDGVIGALARELQALAARRGGRELSLTALFHAPEAGSVQTMPLAPLPEKRDAGARRSAPQLNLPSAELLAELAERYLLARLQALLYGSLMAENERRLRQMDAAIRRLDEDSARLRARANALRQEEITEEIEIIALSARRLMRSAGV
jgi:F-type H+-transporting ATPase subunit gamma